MKARPVMPLGKCRGLARKAPLSLLALLGGCTGVLDPQGPIASAEKTILFNSLGIMLAIVIPTILATLGVAWWFRASNARAKYLPDWEYSGRIEMVVWAIPAMTVLLLGGIGWVGSHDLDPRKPLPSTTSPIAVEVVSLDWKWLFIYPDLGIASVNRLIVPAGAPIRFALTSDGVMNSFFVPQLGSQIYTMAGMTSQLSLLADAPGVYRGLSAQFSGDGFADMHFETQAVTPAAFAAWAQGAKATGPVLDAAAYTALSRPGTSARVTYRAVDPALFQNILSRKQPPGPGPANAPPAPAGAAKGPS